MPLLTWPQRCSHPLCSSQSTDGPTIKLTANPPPHPQHLGDRDREPSGVTATKPIITYPKGHPPQQQTVDAYSLRTQQCAENTDPRPARHVSVPPKRATHPKTPARDTALRTHTTQTGGTSTRMLLRKEVIQPHLPVRLPCYDFVPIASPTFDGSPP